MWNHSADVCVLYGLLPFQPAGYWCELYHLAVLKTYGRKGEVDMAGKTGGSGRWQEDNDHENNWGKLVSWSLPLQGMDDRKEDL